MRKPKVADFTDDDGTIDWEEYEEVSGTYEDIAYDEYQEEKTDDQKSSVENLREI